MCERYDYDSSQFSRRTSIDANPPEKSYGLFMGLPDQIGWWVLSPAALVRMCEMAGFVDVTFVGDFTIKSHANDSVQAIGIAHCRARPE